MTQMDKFRFLDILEVFPGIWVVSQWLASCISAGLQLPKGKKFRRVIRNVIQMHKIFIPPQYVSNKQVQVPIMGNLWPAGLFLAIFACMPMM